MNEIVKEITPLIENDCFTISSMEKKEFDSLLHFHQEFELKLILNAAGAKRMVGDNLEEISELELVLIGPNLSHAWTKHHCESKEFTEVTIQWHHDLFDDKMLSRNQLTVIRRMFERSARGILFPKDTVEKLYPRILAIDQLQGFNSMLELMSILHDLSTSRSMRVLSNATFYNKLAVNCNSRRIDKAYEFMSANSDKPISLRDVAQVVSMTETSFSRFIKKRTGNSYIETLNKIRLGRAVRMLIETTHSVSEIAYNCGFNNLSNFNRLFKKKKRCTPKEFRENFSGTSVFI